MDQFPVEVWLEILRFACTDGGKTGCSLSLVSKYIHNISLEVRFQCVAAHIDHISELATAIQKAAPGHRKIKHLYFETPEEVPRRDATTGRRSTITGMYEKSYYVSILSLLFSTRVDSLI